MVVVQAAGTPPPPRGLPALLAALRPKQWPKNVLVFAAPVASGAVLHPWVLASTFAAFWVLVGASGATYLLNDVHDAKADRLHPVKRDRPVASGRLGTKAALLTAAGLATASLLAAGFLSVGLGVVVACYLGVSAGYTLVLKRLAVIELASVASGFTLRAVAGAAAAHVGVSPWFLVMVSFGALLVVAGKRRSEQMALGSAKAVHRQSLGAYPPEFLRSVRLLAMSVTLTTYCLWAFQRATDLALGRSTKHLVWFELSIIPFVLALLLVELAVARGRSGEPEELALKDHVLQACGLAWVALVVIGIYA
ncbi:MAG: decaprenyl-phosphate phosphoribosyltransferase [Actinobacteria bacterium]|nr:decaprenyl-phosphate phosphoribosyltransferase [Actinomycetota bacterium]